MSIIFLIAMAVIFVGAFIFTRGLRGTPQFSQPRCAGCKYDLRWIDPDKQTQCPECGADLSTPRAVHFGEHRRRPRQMVLGAVVAGLPMLIFLALLIPAVLGIRWSDLKPTSWVLDELATTADKPWQWNELERRFNAGKLSPQQIAAAVDHLIAHLQTPGRRDGPLHWSDDFLELVDQAGHITPQQFARLSDEFYGQAPIQVVVRKDNRSGEPLRFIMRGSKHWDLPGLQFIWALRQVTLDGRQHLDVVAQNDPNRVHNKEYLSGGGVGSSGAHVQFDASPGGHELVFEFDLGLVDKNTRFRTTTHRPGPAKIWPATRRKWTQIVRAKVNIVASGAALVELVTDDAVGAQIQSALTIEYCQAKRDQGKTKLVVRFKRRLELPIPISFDKFVRIDEQEYSAGWFAMRSDHKSFSPTRPVFDELSPEVKTVDVILRSNVKRIERDPAVDRIWSGEIVFKDVPLDRYDLEVDQ